MFLAEYIPGLPVISGAKETLLRLKAKHRFRFVLVTSRQSNIEAETRAWLDKHYPGTPPPLPMCLCCDKLSLTTHACIVGTIPRIPPEVFDSVVLGNHYGRTGVKRCAILP